MSEGTMRAEIVTQRQIMCPRCGAHGWAIDHLAPGQSWGPWQCPDHGCHTAVSGVVREDGAVDLEVTDTPGYVLALCRFRDVYLVVSGYAKAKPGQDYDYLFHSHQCTSNLLSSVKGVFNAEDVDPHGLVRLVAVADDTAELRRKIEETAKTKDLFALFGTDGMELPTKWPERDGGKLPWLAEAQRHVDAKKSTAETLALSDKEAALIGGFVQVHREAVRDAAETCGWSLCQIQALLTKFGLR